MLYSKLLQTYCFVNDYTNRIIYGRKLLHIHRDCGDKHEECWLGLKLAVKYLHQNNSEEAIDLCDKALDISKSIGDRNA